MSDLSSETKDDRLATTGADETYLRDLVGIVKSTAEEDYIGIDGRDPFGITTFGLRVRYESPKMRALGFGDALELEAYTWEGRWVWGRDVDKVVVDYIVFVEELLSGKPGYILDGYAVLEYFEHVLKAMKNGPIVNAQLRSWVDYVLGSEIRFKRNGSKANDKPKLLLYIPPHIFRPWIISEFTI